MLRPKHIRAGQVRVEITKRHNLGGGLGEIEVFAGTMNIARHCRLTADADFEFKDQHDPSALVDGDTSGSTGYWLTYDGKDGWASIHFAEFPPAK
jgi:hypothetical protein